MERHAQQCIACGKDMADAQRLRGMVSELERVKAPESFEASVINEIAKRRLNVRAAGVRRFWIYGYEGALWRKLALASSSLAVVAIGAFIFFNLTGSGQDVAAPVAMEEPGELKAGADAMQNAGMGAGVPSMEQIRSSEVSKAANAAMMPAVAGREFFPEVDAADADFVEQLIQGGDGRPVTVTLPMPRKIYLQYNQTPDEYFIQNISH
jgi:hypothetical protein